MATKKRSYVPGQPVAVGFRFVQRICFFDNRLLRRLFLKLIAHWSVRAKVDIWAFSIQTNHAHLILVQHEHGCPVTVGIAAFMRNVLSRLAKTANWLLGSQGHVVERTYWAEPIESLGEAIRQLAYIHHQNEHHAPRGDGPVYESSRPVYYQMQLDGIVTHVPVLPDLPDDLSPEARQARLLELLDAVATEALAREALGRQAADPNAPDPTAEQQIQARHPWLTAVEDIAPDFLRPRPLDDDTPLDLVDLRTHSGFAAARRAWRNWHMPVIHTVPRNRSTPLGGVIDFRIHTEPCARCAPAPPGPRPPD